jgi:hypothetical protein
MNLLTFLVGMPGKGKTTSFRNLGSDTVMYVTEHKWLPFKDNGIKVIVVNNSDDLITKLKKFAQKDYPQIQNIVLDSFTDFSDMLLSECRTKHKGFDVYSAYNAKIFELFRALQSIENKFIFVTAHPEILQDSEGNTIYRIGVKGKEFEGKVERFATCVFTAETKRKTNGKGVDYYLLTNDDGRFTAKTPMGMFDELYIDNDISQIIEVYKKFYGAPAALSISA